MAFDPKAHPREEVPELRIRVVNAVDLMTLQPKEVHPHGLTDAAFDALFTNDRPVILTWQWRQEAKANA